MGGNKLMTNISQKTGYSKEVCESVINTFAEEIKESLINGEKIIIKGFMSFEINERPERNGRNPKTGEVVSFPPVKTIKCKISKAIKEAINEK
jgi:DNA-binding protein HU-beta